MFPPCAVYVQLNDEDRAALGVLSEKPDDFVAIVASSAQFMLGFQDIPTPDGVKRVCILQAIVIVPPDILAPDPTFLLDKDGNPAPSERIQKALTQIPLMVRALVRRSALTPAYQADVSAPANTPILPFIQRPPPTES